MKNRNLFNNIFTILIMASLVCFLLTYFEVFGNETIWGWTQKIALPVAMISAICMEIVLPVLDNKELFKTNKRMKILLIVKSILVIAAIIPLVLNVSGALDQNTSAEFGVLAAFVILYMAQFFINLDPKPETSEEDEEDDEDYDDEEDADEDVETDDSEDVVDESEETEDREEYEE
ncbi:MAG: hypothetical protein E7388_01580 [Ruminococcaceae bacterium]|nr:hypothetical protein [Oscillospiraceae bacterium]